MHTFARGRWALAVGLAITAGGCAPSDPPPTADDSPKAAKPRKDDEPKTRATSVLSGQAVSQLVRRPAVHAEHRPIGLLAARPARIRAAPRRGGAREQLVVARRRRIREQRPATRGGEQPGHDDRPHSFNAPAATLSM